MYDGAAEALPAEHRGGMLHPIQGGACKGEFELYCCIRGTSGEARKTSTFQANFIFAKLDSFGQNKLVVAVRSF